MEQTANTVKTTINIFLDEAEGLINILTQDEEIINALSGKDIDSGIRELKRMTSSVPFYYGAILFNKSGQIIGGYNGQSADGISIESMFFSKDALDPNSKPIQVYDTVFKSKDDSRLLFAITGQSRDAQGNLLGGVVLYPDWTKFTDTVIDPIKVGAHGYGLMMDDKATVIAHAENKSILLNNNFSYAFNRTIVSTKQGHVSYTWDGKDKIAVFDYTPKTDWIVSISAYESDLAAAAISQRDVLIIGGIIVVALIVFICMLLLRKLLVRPINDILKYTTAVAAGDLKAELTGTFKYEFVELSTKIKIMVGELKQKLGFAEGVLNGLAMPCTIVDKDLKLIWLNRQISELARNSSNPEEFIGMDASKFYFDNDSGQVIDAQAIKNQSTEDVEFMQTFPNGKECALRVTATPFYDMDGKLLGSVSNIIDLTEIRTQQKQIEEQNQKISKAAVEADTISQHLATAAEELSAQVEQASKGADSQRDRMAETATAMNQMNISVLEVARNAAEAAQVTENARKEAERGASNLNELIQTIAQVQAQSLQLKESMGNLGEQAQGIGTVMNVITDIADQTNLLALNAAIEAARAGDAGRGFAVVADEVRKLAEKTMDATKEVGTAIADIQHVADQNIQDTDNTVNKVAESTKLAKLSGEVLKSIVGMMENAASQVSGIATAAEEQSSTSEQINHSTEEVNQLTSETSEIMSESANAVQEVSHMAAELTQLIEVMS